MNTYPNNVIVNGVEVMDASDMIEYPLDLTIHYTRDVGKGRIVDDAEICNWND